MKFYDSILSGLRQFFGKPEATEAELDNALSEVTQTLAELQSGSGVDGLTEQVNQMTERLNGFETQLADLTAQLADRDTTIQALTEQLTETQAEINTRDEQIAALTAQIDEAKAAHNTQVSALSATIASLKAGKAIQKQTEAPVQLPKEAETTETKVQPIKDAKLASMLGLPVSN